MLQNNTEARFHSRTEQAYKDNIACEAYNLNDLHEAYNKVIANPTVENMYLVRAAECQFNIFLDAKTGTQSAINSKTGEWEVLPELPVVDKVLFPEY